MTQLYDTIVIFGFFGNILKNCEINPKYRKSLWKKELCQILA